MNMMMGPDADRPMGLDQGVNAAHERRWGLIGGALGALCGVGIALEAVFVEHSGWYAGSSYPPFFATHRLLAFDGLLIGILVIGEGLLIGAIVTARAGRYPRTDVSGATTGALVLTSLAGTLLFFRLLAVIRGG